MKNSFQRKIFWIFRLFCRLYLVERRRAKLRTNSRWYQHWIVAIASNNAISPYKAALFPCKAPIFILLVIFRLWFPSQKCGGQIFRCPFPPSHMARWGGAVRWTMIQISLGAVFHYMHTAHNKSGSARWKGGRGKVGKCGKIAAKNCRRHLPCQAVQPA